MSFTTAGLCNEHWDNEHFWIAEPIFKMYGANRMFCGQITTLKVFEDNALVREALAEPVTNRVLVIDGGGSHRCALLGEKLARTGIANGWQGIIVYGCIRDSAVIDSLPIGIRALHAHPMKSFKRGHGERDINVTFAGITFKKDYFLYADADGIIVSEAKLS